MPETPFPPPKAINRAIGCIWVSFGIDTLSWISLFFMDVPEYITRVIGQVHVSLQSFLILKLCALSIDGVIIYWVLRKLALGRDWARILCLLQGVIALPTFIYRFLSYHDDISRMESLIWNIPYLGFGYYALYLLFTAPGKDWFKRKQLS